MSSLNLKKINEKIYPAVVWALRLIVGGIFIFAGFTKVIDPWGFMYKVEEYLNVWGIDWLWREVVVCLSSVLSIIEFCIGVMVLTGCLRRSICWALALMMLFMLPLTAYIAIKSPVADCGCFGEAYIISNTATFYKNVFITIATIYLLYNNNKVNGLFPPLSQWLVLFASIFYCLILVFFGFTVQPLIDFRPYKTGTYLMEESEENNIKLIYEKDGQEKEFGIDEIPDSTWTYIKRKITLPSEEKSFAVFEDNEDVTHEVIDSDGEEILLIISKIERHNKARASMANNVNDYIKSRGGRMIGVIAADPEGVNDWIKEAEPEFPIYTSDDTLLKELVRGDAGMLYLIDGKIIWKRNIYSLPGDFPDFEKTNNQLADIYVIDSGKPILYLSGIYICLLLVIFLLGLIRIKNAKKVEERQ